MIRGWDSLDGVITLQTCLCDGAHYGLTVSRISPPATSSRSVSHRISLSLMNVHGHREKKCFDAGGEKKDLSIFVSSVMLCCQVAVCVSVQQFASEPNSIKSDVSILLPVTFQTIHRFPCYFCSTSHRFLLYNPIPPLIQCREGKKNIITR